MCSTNICDMLKIHGTEDLETGSIEEGGWADLVIGNITGEVGRYQLDVNKVFVRGRQVYGAVQA